MGERGEIPDIYTSAEVAAMVRRSQSCLAYWRSKKIGPPWFRFNGKHVAYPAAGFRDWWEQQQRDGAA